MRIPHWPVLICGGLLAAVIGQTAFAYDSADGYIDASPVVTANGGGAGELFADPDYEGQGRAGYQQVQYMQGSPGNPAYGGPVDYGSGYGVQYWPEVSPFSPHALDTFQNDAGIWQYQGVENDPRAILDLDFLIGWGVKPGNHLIGSQISEFFPGVPTVFPAQRTSNVGDMKHFGLRARYGWENPDESGLTVSAFYLADRSYTAGPNTTFFNPVYGQPNPPFGIQPLASITYAAPGGPVQTLYDTSFEKTFDQQFWGVDVDVYAAPFFKRPNFRMQMTYGAKWVRVFESMSVRAVDSSFGYVVASDGTISNIVDNGLPPLVTTINSQVVSNLVGPQIGVRYDLGGDKLKIWGQSKVAVAANMDQTRVYGANALPNFSVGNVPFSNSISHTHISPIFEQQIFGQFPIFSIIPIINRWSFINGANFRVGFDYLLIGEMARPANAVNYNLNNPYPNSTRTTFSLKTVSFGLEWVW